jgi:hypothetical protein
MDPITLQLYRHRFTGIAEEMGITLRRTAYSPNIKERLDFSCAIFDGRGNLVAQAAHIPAHLGAMPASVHTILDPFPHVGGGRCRHRQRPFRGRQPPAGHHDDRAGLCGMMKRRSFSSPAAPTTPTSVA